MGFNRSSWVVAGMVVALSGCTRGVAGDRRSGRASCGVDVLCDERVDGLRFEMAFPDWPTAAGGVRRLTALEDDARSNELDIPFRAESTDPNVLRVEEVTPPGLTLRGTGDGTSTVRLRASDTGYLLDQITLEVATVERVEVVDERGPILLVGASELFAVALHARDGRRLVDEDTRGAQIDAGATPGVQALTVQAAGTDWTIPYEVVDEPEALALSLQPHPLTGDELVLERGDFEVSCATGIVGDRRVWGVLPATEIDDASLLRDVADDLDSFVEPDCRAFVAEELGETTLRIRWGDLAREIPVRVVEAR